MSGPNLDFYSNKRPSEPDGDFIENILRTWKGDYDRLEKNCAYIQWLFPNKEAGKNPAASPLTPIEAENTTSRLPDYETGLKRSCIINDKMPTIQHLEVAVKILISSASSFLLLLFLVFMMIRDDAIMKERVKRAFKMMLDFFGMELDVYDNFTLANNSDERLEQINHWGSTAFLHINRILLSLKELGHEKLMLPWMVFLTKLVYVEKKLDRAENSFEQFWMETLSEKDLIEIQILLNQCKK